MTPCRRGGKVEKEEDTPETGGQHAGSAEAEGADQVPSVVTPADYQGKSLDEHSDDLDGDKLPGPFPNARGRSRSPALGARSEAEGGAAPKKDGKIGMSRRMASVCHVQWICEEHRKGIS